MIIIADIFLAANFVFQKKYQQRAGTSFKAGLVYNALMGLISAIMFLVINKFDIQISLYSIIMAALFATVVMSYTFVGFKIMEKGNMSLYTLFLMSGGMTVPYVWGVLFLNEELSVFRVIGLAAIIAAIIIYNSGVKQIDKKQILLCIAVFFLNGMSSVASKMHQINPVSEIVTSTDFAFIVMIFKAIICSVIMIICRDKMVSDKQEKLPVKSLLPIIILAAVADGITYVLQLIGATELPATVLYPLVTGGSIILTAFAGVIVFREKISAKQWTGVALCFIGTLLFL